ncbi:ankyrin repeat-containing domain protein [Mycena metata]|uniref:Ankyrin repeat-containing domain protein n=1 Tax=Mycena metata TaxID=1033252 RepID=A0AAD7N7D7_9AGAR|nr:ankyrin repeat-containing domain protein [Mycena metata]
MSLTFKAFSHLLQRPIHLFTHNPFLHYTVEYCLVHARGGPEIEIPASILSFLSECSVWWRLWNWKHGGRHSTPDKLHIATVFHLEVISKRIIEEDSLHKAVVRGDADEVQTLVRNGVELGKYCVALQEAVIHGHEQILSFLAAHEMEHQLQSETNTALRDDTGTESVGQEGLDSSLNLMNGHSCAAALYHASWTGNKGMVMLLIQHGAPLNAAGGMHGSAAGAAVAAGHLSVLQLLVGHGANINVTYGMHGGMLQTASSQGYEDIVQWLLEKGANINAGPPWHRSALHLAISGGHKSIVKLLLKHLLIPHTRSN